jgi:putative NIF3 family GTP cyclohydrolase 1 type 2
VVEVLGVEDGPAGGLAVVIDELEVVVDEVLDEGTDVLANAHPLFFRIRHEVVVEAIEEEMAPILVPNQTVPFSPATRVVKSS